MSDKKYNDNFDKDLTDEELLEKLKDIPVSEEDEALSVDELIQSSKAELGEYAGEDGTDALPPAETEDVPEEPLDTSTMVVPAREEEPPFQDTSPEPMYAENIFPEEAFRDQEYRETFDNDFESVFEEDKVYAEDSVQYHKPSKARKGLTRACAALIYIAAAVAASVALAFFGWKCADDVLALTKEDQVISVTIPENATLDDIADVLHESGLIKYPWLFKIYGSYTNVEKYISAGTYELNSLFDYHALVNGLYAGSSTRMTATVMVTEGYDCGQIFQLLEDCDVCTVEELEETAANYAFEYDFLEGVELGSSNRLEGYLYPDTYEFYIGDSAENVLDKFLANFDNKFDEDMRAKAAAAGHTIREVITVASLIEEEAASDEERSTIASVIYNRLNSDYRRLELDSTVFYAASLLDQEFSTSIDSPYNTYLVEGLPVGPIDNPGMKSIQAALEPANTNYYYFAYGKDGVSHFFQYYSSFTEFCNSDEYEG